MTEKREATWCEMSYVSTPNPWGGAGERDVVSLLRAPHSLGGGDIDA